MTDKEKVVKGMECCFTDMDRSDSMPCSSCPYGTLPKKTNCQKQMFADVLAMLKEQEPRRVLSQRECETLPNHYERKGFCPKCNQVVEWYLNRSYCGFCGQAIKWD